jgi:hypothetical protein
VKAIENIMAEEEWLGSYVLRRFEGAMSLPFADEAKEEYRRIIAACALEQKAIPSGDALLARMKFAELYPRNVSSDGVIELLGLKPPLDNVSNADLEPSKALFIEVVSDIKRKGRESEFLDPLFRREGNDIVICLILEFLNYLPRVRFDRLGNSTENFEFLDLADEILDLKVVGHWCRQAVNDQALYCCPILQAIINFLSFSVYRQRPEIGINVGVPVKQARKTAREVIFMGADDVLQGLNELRNDFLPILLDRPDLRESPLFPGIITDGINLQQAAVFCLDLLP